MTNHRLIGAIRDAELSAEALAVQVGVDRKSVVRWISEDRVPYPSTRIRVAHVLNQHETFLWPALLSLPGSAEAAHAELTRVWPTRSAVSTECWHSLFSHATERLDLLVYAGGFLIETLDLSDVISWKATHGARVRVLVGDPASHAVIARADELAMNWLPARCATTSSYLKEVARLGGVDLRRHSTTLYASLFRFDDIVLVNDHAFGVWACHSPVYQLRRAVDGHLFDFYADTFERVWAAADPSHPADQPTSPTNRPTPPSHARPNTPLAR